MLVKELIYSILDLCKMSGSDDSIINEDHIVFLCKKYRSFLIKKEQEKEKSSSDIASEFEYQQICLSLESSTTLGEDACTGQYLRTTVKLPKLLEGCKPRIYPSDFFQGANVCYVSRDRLRMVGYNKWLKDIIFVGLGPDNKLYLKSSNPNFMYLEGDNTLKVSGLFEDFDEAYALTCSDDSADSTCDVLEMTFPMRDYLVPTLIELVSKEVLGTKYNPQDSQNNASDDLAELAAFVRRNVRNTQ